MSEYKLVPVEPTREMRKAGRGGWATNDPEEAARATYQAMLAAAPSPEWVKTSDRLPTREDADERGNVWCAHRHGWGVGEHPYSWVHDSTQSHWMPKPRREPPAPPVEGREK